MNAGMYVDFGGPYDVVLKVPESDEEYLKSTMLVNTEAWA
jgi:hypothetical protein